jgi:hypothetical protein
VHRNPQTVALPSALPLSPDERTAFAAATVPAVEQLELARAVAAVRVAARR